MIIEMSNEVIGNADSLKSQFTAATALTVLSPWAVWLFLFVHITLEWSLGIEVAQWWTKQNKSRKKITWFFQVFQNGSLWRSFADVLKHVRRGLDEIIVYISSFLFALILGAFFLLQVRILCQPMIGLQRAHTNNKLHDRVTKTFSFLPNLFRLQTVLQQIEPL